MALSYEEALETLQSMFEEPWTRDTLDAVLRHQKGHMENTVDFILRHSGKDPQTLVDQLKAGVNPDEATISMDEELARQLSQGSQRRSSARSSATAGAGSTSSGGGGGGSSGGGRGTPTTLPDDFLRIPGRTVTTTTSASTLESDAALARMLQDELFTEELARNPDFAHLARGRSRTAAAGSTRTTAAGTRSAAATGRSNFHATSTTPMSPNIMHKISELGDNARKRLQILAAQFNAARTNPNGLGGGAGAGGAAGAAAGQSPTAAASERRGLLDDHEDHDDMELAARKDL